MMSTVYRFEKGVQQVKEMPGPQGGVSQGSSFYGIRNFRDQGIKLGTRRGSKNDFLKINL
jgi:hypothetical protein